MTAATPDPTLATLVPEPSRRRTAALVAVAVLLVVGAWFLAPLLRPTLSQEGSEVAGPFPDIPAALYRVTAQGPLTIERVTGTEAAQVVGAWAVPDDDGWPRVADEYVPADTPTDLLRASGINPDGAALPYALADGESVWLLVAWRVTGCPTVDLASWGDITVRSALGIESDRPLSGDPPLYAADTVTGCP